jgi:DHA1 family multidrug resistance protein-like MFS transporter
MGFSLVYPFIPLYIQQLGVPDAKRAAFWAGLTGAAMGVSLFLTGPVWGMVGDRYGRKGNVVRAMFGSSFLLIMSGLVTQAYHLVILRFFSGVFSGILAPAMALVASVAPPGRLPTVVGLLQMAMTVAFTLGPLIGGVLAAGLGYRWAFFISGALVAMAGVGVLFLVKENFQRPKELERVSPRSVLKDYVAMVTKRDMFITLLILLSAQIASIITFPILPVFIGELSPEGNINSLAGLAFGVNGMASSIATASIGRITGRYGLRIILIVSPLAAGAILLSVLAVQSAYQLIPILAAVSLFSGAMTAAATAQVGTRATSGRYGRAFGAAQSVMAVGWGVGPFLGGALAQVMGLRMVYLVSIAFFLLVAFLALRFVPGGTGATQTSETVPAAQAVRPKV